MGRSRGRHSATLRPAPRACAWRLRSSGPPRVRTVHMTGPEPETHRADSRTYLGASSELDLIAPREPHRYSHHHLSPLPVVASHHEHTRQNAPGSRTEPAIGGRSSRDAYRIFG